MDEPAAQAGFHGKLPATGDFVSRGLPDAFRRNWDAWVTRHLAGPVRSDGTWPEGGLRFRLTSGGRVAAGVILRSADSAGRVFPLSLILIGETLPGPAVLDQWCDAAFSLGEAAAAGESAPDALWEALDRLRPPAGSGEAGPPLVLWANGTPPVDCPPDEPASAVGAILAAAATVSSG